MTASATLYEGPYGHGITLRMDDPAESSLVAEAVTFLAATPEQAVALARMFFEARLLALHIADVTREIEADLAGGQRVRQPGWVHTLIGKEDTDG